jgi:GntR family transcriptional regulator
MPQRALPKYLLVKATLLDWLRREFAPGAKLPPELELCRSFGVSRITVRQALQLMEKEGLVVREQGRGTFYQGEPSPTEPAGLSSLLESVMKYREGAFARLVRKAVVPATPRIAERLRIPAGSRVVTIERVAGEDGAPVLFVVAFLPYEIGAKVLDDVGELQRPKPIVSILQDKYGVQITSVLQTITAALADPTVASLLELEIGAPVLEVERTYLGADAQPVNFSMAFYRTDRYRFQVAMKDWR